MKISLLFASTLLLAAALTGCGSDTPAPVTSENNGVKPVPDYNALIKAEQDARDKAKAGENQDSENTQ